MTEVSSKRTKPKYTGLMAGWFVFVAFYQTFLAAHHGGLFLGANDLVSQDLNSIDLVVMYTAMGVLFLILAYGVWALKWWAFPFGLIVQGMVIAVALMGVLRWVVLGQQAPIIWDALDLLFAVINLSWALSRDVRMAYVSQQSSAG